MNFFHISKSVYYRHFPCLEFRPAGLHQGAGLFPRIWCGIIPAHLVRDYSRAFGAGASIFLFVVFIEKVEDFLLDSQFKM